MKRLAAVTLIAISGCSQKPPEPPKPLVWTSLPDGSKTNIGEGFVAEGQFFDGPSAVMRCWPMSDGGFDCLVATRQTYNFMYFTRTKTAKLPEQYPLLMGPPVGYQCAASPDGGWQESIHSEAGEIKLSVVSTLQHPRPPSWTKAEVEKVFAENAIQPESHWLNCRNITRVVGGTSLAAVASTEVTQEVVGG